MLLVFDSEVLVLAILVIPEEVIVNVLTCYWIAMNNSKGCKII
jgi:hypothetical protein